MKDGKFETQAEIYQALLDSKKIKRETWSPEAYIHLVKGGLRDRFGEDMEHIQFCPPDEFLIYEEPKPKKKVTLYNYLYDDGGNLWESGFTSKTFDEINYLCEVKLLKTESKEVEYDDVN